MPERVEIKAVCEHPGAVLRPLVWVEECFYHWIVSSSSCAPAGGAADTGELVLGTVADGGDFQLRLTFNCG